MDAVEDSLWWYRALHARALAALPAGPGALLDAGCGTGGFLARVATARPDLRLTGVEFRPQAAARAAAKSGHPVAAGTVNALPFGDGRFGIAVSLDVLSHGAVDPVAALAELHRVLTPGGRVVANLPAFEWLRSAHDRRVHNARRFTAGGARSAFAAAGFAAVRARYWNALLLPLMAVQRKLAARAPDHGSDVAPFSPWLDRSLHAVTVLEQRLARAGIGFPAGGSLLVTATRL